MNDPLEIQIEVYGRKARKATTILSQAASKQKNAAIEAIADGIMSGEAELLSANQRDVEKAKAANLSSAMVDRLTLTPKRIAEMAKGMREIAALHDPVGENIKEWTRPNGLTIRKRRVPIGVVAMIYESRPNVTCDAAALCLKTGNACILRGGSEAFESSKAIVAVIASALATAGLPSDSVQIIETTDREAVRLLCEMDSFVDVIVPRGGHALIETVTKNARMPVIKHYHGICHVFVDRNANFAMAEKIILNAKTQRPSACNAMETLLVDEVVAPVFLPSMAASLTAVGVDLRGDRQSRHIVPSMKEATEEDWRTEYLDMILSVRIVSGVEEAMEHIEQFGSRHSDAIVTENMQTAERFLNQVDSATVYWNASTRFTDGGEFGFGAELGISTDKLHARGPMGLEELTTYKYQILGNGQTRA